MTLIRRRTILAGMAASVAAPRFVAAQAAPLQVFAHRVHQTVAVGTQGGDATAAWTKQTGLAVEWTTFDTGPLQERLLREAALGQSAVDVGFLLNTQAVPRTAGLFEPLDTYLVRDPIEEPVDVFPGLMSGMKVGGQDSGRAGASRLVGPALERGDPAGARLCQAAGDHRGAGRGGQGLHLPAHRRHAVRRPVHAGCHLPERHRHCPRLERRFHHTRLQGGGRSARHAQRHQAAARPVPGRRLPAHFRSTDHRGRGNLDAAGAGGDGAAKHGAQPHLQRSAEEPLRRQDPDWCRADLCHA